VLEVGISVLKYNILSTERRSLGTREKYLEQTLEKALRSLILVEHHPRTLIQIVVQIVEADDHTSVIIFSFHAYVSIQ